ncbi:MAG TPA: DNA-formamidopyrimidine glycosylase family protein [Thermoanaerobaculia bacterium]|nr:DNA-formamidopyrimidine glycosylase family protein [Thermoanaerobaculia bacterium]
MPEGDTIFRAARTLNEALAGKTVTRFETVLPQLAHVDDQTPLRGRKVERVTSSGKNLIIEFSGALVLRTHLRMNGSWHLYRRGERWRKRRGDMRLVIATDDFEAVGFNIPVAEFASVRAGFSRPDRPEPLAALGPDLLAETFDIDEAERRILAHGDEEIGNALLNQRLVAGIGNIWKSETLFACGVNPFRLAGSCDVRAILKKARALLQRSTRERPRFLVYERGGQPCRKCGTAIVRKLQNLRGTYFCPKCQS